MKTTEKVEYDVKGNAKSVKLTNTNERGSSSTIYKYDARGKPHLSGVERKTK